MQLRMLFRPMVSPFMPVRSAIGTPSRRGGLFAAKSQSASRGITAGKGRRHTA